MTDTLAHGSRAGGMTALFIKRPVMTTLIMIGIVIFGVIAYRQLPVSDLPTVDFPTIFVRASLPGATKQSRRRERPCVRRDVAAISDVRRAACDMGASFAALRRRGGTARHRAEPDALVNTRGNALFNYV